MNLLFSLDETYVPPMKVLLFSIFQQHQEETFAVYLLHGNMREETLEDLRVFIEEKGHSFHPIECKDVLTKGKEVKISLHYTVDMYYWLFAPFLLPEEVDRVLYLDADTICVNSMKEFYEQSFGSHLFAASSHQYVTKFLQPLNKLRLNTIDLKSYYNSGVVLMDLASIRKESTRTQIVEAIQDANPLMWLPDQDVFNQLYTGKIKETDWRYYNLGPKIFESMNFIFPNTYNEQWVEQKVVFIHYYGKKKPWTDREAYDYKLGRFYFEWEKALHLSDKNK